MALFARWLIIGVVAVVAIGLVGWYCIKGRSYNTPTMSFDGSSDQLQQTVIVPTLDSPLLEGKSAIWCVSFQLAWNRLKEDVAKEPLQLTNALPISDRLNQADHSDEDVGPDAVYAAAGLTKDGIVERIRAQMATKFPNVPRPELANPPEGAVAYAYLAASAKFNYPFFENDEPFLFKDSVGKQTAVGSFGIRENDGFAYHQLRGQVQVLYCPRKGREIAEFIVDPCRTSQPYQIVLARVDRKPTLADTLADIEQKIASHREGFFMYLGPTDKMLVPNIGLRVSHRFKELEGKETPFLNPALRGQYLETALQVIGFRLDRSGAELASEFRGFSKSGPSFFDFNRPFLIIMKKRGAKRPFFVMWVENAELLEKK